MRRVVLGRGREDDFHEQLRNHETGHDAACIVLGLDCRINPRVVGALLLSVRVLRQLIFVVRRAARSKAVQHDPQDDQSDEHADRRHRLPQHAWERAPTGAHRGDACECGDVARDLASSKAPLRILRRPQLVDDDVQSCKPCEKAEPGEERLVPIEALRHRSDSEDCEGGPPNLFEEHRQRVVQHDGQINRDRSTHHLPGVTPDVRAAVVHQAKESEVRKKKAYQQS
mmetsp:Transcript_116315/g.325329  ORF Transcript_116315/g.325329 Transcript_116315/m.325329 type:complete len:227 (-) Transcript_116315:147-827(-)